MRARNLAEFQKVFVECERQEERIAVLYEQRQATMLELSRAGDRTMNALARLANADPISADPAQTARQTFSK